MEAKDGRGLAIKSLERRASNPRAWVRGVDAGVLGVPRKDDRGQAAHFWSN
jgi:hypothetical protein